MFTLFLLSCDGSRIASVEQEELSAIQTNTINAVQEPSQITSIEDTANLLEIIGLGLPALLCMVLILVIMLLPVLWSIIFFS
ncbi:MAG: hypothetical protein EA359_01640, partial [Balneolaceae bacterium]